MLYCTIIYFTVCIFVIYVFLLHIYILFLSFNGIHGGKKSKFFYCTGSCAYDSKDFGLLNFILSQHQTLSSVKPSQTVLPVYFCMSFCLLTIYFSVCLIVFKHLTFQLEKLTQGPPDWTLNELVVIDYSRKNYWDKIKLLFSVLICLRMIRKKASIIHTNITHYHTTQISAELAKRAL